MTTRWTASYDEGYLITFLPTDVYERRSMLLDITPIGDVYRKFLDSKTGIIHDSAVYANQAAIEAKEQRDAS